MRLDIISIITFGKNAYPAETGIWWLVWSLHTFRKKRIIKIKYNFVYHSRHEPCINFKICLWSSEHHESQKDCYVKYFCRGLCHPCRVIGNCNTDLLGQLFPVVSANELWIEIQNFHSEFTLIFFLDSFERLESIHFIWLSD